MSFRFKKLEISDVILIEPHVFEDGRGFFLETYRQEDFRGAGIALPFVQDNHARSARGVLRGLHYQKDPMPQGKLVRCVRGAIFDVAVDIRKRSPTYGKWLGMVLSEKNHRILWIPRGFAHGYLALEDGSEVLYKTDNAYAPELERGILWNDPKLGIEWPDPHPSLSDRDAALPPLNEADNPFAYSVD